MTSFKLSVLSGLLFSFLVGCGGGGSGDGGGGGTTVPPVVVVPPPPPTPTSDGPAELIGNAFSGTSIGISWLHEPGVTYTIFRDTLEVAETEDSYFIDTGLGANTTYTYTVTTDSATTSAITAKTLVNTSNNGRDNGAETVIVNQRLNLFTECGGARNVNGVPDTSVEACLREMLQFNSMSSHLEDMRAFAARVRSEQAPDMVELGMRLFHSKSLSPNHDAACSSCHHPALGCGGDDLSMPVGVNAIFPDLLGPGRSDGTNDVPTVPRNSQATCNSTLWTRGVFWDNRVQIATAAPGVPCPRGELCTESQDVTDATIAAVGRNSSLTLLMAQAHFPVTAAAEMGDITLSGYDDTVDSEHTAFREEVLADGLSGAEWGELFAAAYGDPAIDYSRIAEAIAAYESVQIFIDNPFFEYVDGDPDAISEEAKRGAIIFMAAGNGCTFCHAGAFFSTQAPLPANYPQIGIGKDEGGVVGADVAVFRAPTLLNVGITGPWGHNGQWPTLERNVFHYEDHDASIDQYFANDEMCELDQFADLVNCASQVAPNGLALTQAVRAGNNEFAAGPMSVSARGWLVEFLETLTDPDAANVNSNAIQALIPSRDGGPDGNQLDAVDELGNEL